MKMAHKGWLHIAALLVAGCVAALGAACAPPASVRIPPEFSPASGRPPERPSAPTPLPAESAIAQPAGIGAAPPLPDTALAPLFAQVKRRYAFHTEQLGRWRALGPGHGGSADCLRRLSEIVVAYEQLLVKGAVGPHDLEMFVQTTDSDMAFPATRCDALLLVAGDDAPEAEARQDSGAPATEPGPQAAETPSPAAGRQAPVAPEIALEWSPQPAPVTPAPVAAAEPLALPDQPAREEQWEKAVNLLGLRRYEEAIQAFAALRGTEYDGQARARIAEAENLAAFEMRRTAAALFVQAGKAGSADRQRRLLLESRTILREILEKYPEVESRDKILQNLETLEKQLRTLDGPSATVGPLDG